MDVAEASLIVVSVWVTSLFFALVLGHWLEMAKDEGWELEDVAGAQPVTIGAIKPVRRITRRADGRQQAQHRLARFSASAAAREGRSSSAGPAASGADISTPYFIFVPSESQTSTRVGKPPGWGESAGQHSNVATFDGSILRQDSVDHATDLVGPRRGRSATPSRARRLRSQNPRVPLRRASVGASL